MTLRATELRIENLILFKDRVGTVRQIKLKDGEYFIEMQFLHPFEEFGEEFWSVELPVWEFKPIPISDAWFQRLGYTKNEKSWFPKYPFYIKWMDWMPEGWWLMRDHEVPIRKIEYVHICQNIVYDLTVSHEPISLTPKMK